MISISGRTRSHQLRKVLWAGLFVSFALSPLRAQFTEYPLPRALWFPTEITSGPDGALWFAAGEQGGIGRITTSGSITGYPTAEAVGITAGPDGALWFTEYQVGKIGRITTSGSITEYPLPPTANGNSGPYGITAGPDGALWFTEVPLTSQGGANNIGRITTSGSITEYPVPTAGSRPIGITTGPDGALWFSEYQVGKIGRITTSGSITEYSLPTSSGPSSITAGPDGALWFTESAAAKIGRITTSGSITESAAIASDTTSLWGITTGPDGALWFTDRVGNILRITTSGSVTYYYPPTSPGTTWGITTGPDGALWFTEQSAGRIGRYAPLSLSSLKPASATAGGPAFTLTVNGSGFASGVVVDWNGSPLTTTYVSATQVTALVPAGLITAAGTAAVTVMSHGLTSNSATFIVNGVLAINSLNPASVPAGGPAFTLTVSGSGFTSGAVVDWNGSPLPATFLDSTQVIASVSASLITSAGTVTITVLLSSGTSAKATFTVTPSGNSQCTNIGGSWNVSELGSYTETITAPVETDTVTNPVNGNASTSIMQTGCSISYNPPSQGGLIGSNPTSSQLASLTRTGTVSGNNVSVTGLLALIDTVGSARAGFTVTDVSSNTLNATGQVMDNVITLSETGTLVVSGTYSINGQSGPFTETITSASTAIFTRRGFSIASGGVVPVDSTVNTIQPGEWVSIFGTNLANSTLSWNGNFPTSLGGTSVTINGRAAYPSFVSPGQINVQAPNDGATGTVPVVVTTGSGTATSTVTLAQFAPSFLLLDGKHVTGIIIRSNGSGAYGGGAYDIIGPTGDSLGYPTVAAQAGDTIELFALGLGPTDPPVSAGKVFSGSAPTTNPVDLTIHNVSVTPSFAGLSGAGLYQINLTVPAGLGTGDVALVAAVGGVRTPSGVVISVQ